MKETPSDARTHYNVAVVADVLGMQDRATQSIERAIELDPQSKYMRFLSSLRERSRVSVK